MPYYSFVLLCYNKWELTQQAISTLILSLSSIHKDKGMELIVVNNGSSDETKEGLEKIREQYQHEFAVVPIHLKQNVGYPVGINKGLAKCNGQMITVLNNDLVFPANWFDGIVQILENNQSIGMAVPFLSYGSGLEHLNVSFQSLEEMRTFAQTFMEENKDKLLYSERVIGACLTLKREVLDLIGGNDFWFGLGLFDDDDWSLRAGIAGYKSVITGASFVHHIGTVTFHQQSDHLSYAFQSNYPKFARKWSGNGLDHTNRKGIIQNTAYAREEHFFPLNNSDFNPLNQTSNRQKLNDKRKLIMVADWTNDLSRWKSKLKTIIESLSAKTELYLWIPMKYYPETKVKEEIDNERSTEVFYLFNDVPPVDLLHFFDHYDSFLVIEDDFVNLSLKNLVKENLEIDLM